MLLEMVLYIVVVLSNHAHKKVIVVCYVLKVNIEPR